MARPRKKRGTKVKNRQVPENPPKQKNAKFPVVAKVMYKYLQTAHHQAVLSALPEGALPPALQRKQAEMDRFWKPSSSTEAVQAKFMDLSRVYMRSGVDTMKQHYAETETVLAERICSGGCYMWGGH